MSIADKLTTIAENEQRVYNAGYESGYSDGGSGGSYDVGWSEGYSRGYADGEIEGWDSGYSSGWDEGYSEGEVSGIEQGKQAQEDAFWEAYQQNGTRTDYQGAFGGLGWTNEIFKPKYDIVTTNAAYMFRISGLSGDLVEILGNLGVTLDFSKTANFTETFSNCYNITRVGVIDISKATNATNMFTQCSALKTIDKLIVSASTAFITFPGTVNKLENLTIEGTIGKNGMNLSSATKLSKASITSIINALSTTTSGLSITLSSTAVTAAFGSTTASEWTTLVSSRSNWTISLV